LRDRPSRSPLDGDITELIREAVDDDGLGSAAENSRVDIYFLMKSFKTQNRYSHARSNKH